MRKDYFDLTYELSLILAIIPFTCWICGAITRFLDGKIVAGLVRLIFGFSIIWFLDIVYMVMHKRIFRLLTV